MTKSDDKVRDETLRRMLSTPPKLKGEQETPKDGPTDDCTEDSDGDAKQSQR